MKFIIQRLGLFIAALAGLSLLVFLALRILPGDVAAVIAGSGVWFDRSCLRLFVSAVA